MTVISAQQIKEWDEFTILHEPIASIDLMERAAKKCVEWMLEKKFQQQHFKIFCGKGNNGGDGLAIARLLMQKGFAVTIYIIEFGKLGADDFQTNLQRLHDLPIADIHFIQTKEAFPGIDRNDIVVDALFGSGLNKPLESLAADLVEHINNTEAVIVSIDLPSGLFIDASSKNNKVVEADHTLAFQCYKRALLVAENAKFIGEVDVLDIGLHTDFLINKTFDQHLIEIDFIKQIFKPRNRFAHKGNFGHALIVTGSYGKIGAAILSAKACLRSGVGLLTAYIPKCGYSVMQSSVPEAMVLTDENENTIASLPDDIEKYSVIGIGPGIGTADETQKLISFIIRRYHKPLVIDADALNCLSQQKELLKQLQPYSILTPHLKEFDRLFGDHTNDFDRINTVKEKAAALQIVIVLKGHHTIIATPGGQMYFNCTGNAGMAKGGSGDVLTGIITALIAQQYDPVFAAVLGVYLHGLAGDIAAKTFSKEAMIASDIIRFLPAAFLKLL